MKRVLIFANEKFPRGSAGANYIEYFALALKYKGWDVIVFGRGENRDIDLQGDRYIYKGIEYFNNTKKLSTFRKLLGDKVFYNSIVEQFHVSKEDYIIFYSIDFSLFSFLYSIVSPQRVCVIRVEDLQSYQFHYGYLNPKYILYRRALNFARRKYGKIIAISTIIDKQEQKEGCRTLLLPIMANPYEFGFTEREKNEEIQILYPGMKVTPYEDDVALMMKAVMRVASSHDANFKMHITGIKQSAFIEWGKKANLDINKLMSLVKIHGWLDYPSLIRLYQNTDFLLLARKRNEVTMANFPSKVPEMMSFGIVPICTEVGDYTSLYLQDGINSILFKSSDMEGCCNAIIRASELSAGEYKKMRYNANSLVQEKFYYKHWADKISKFILSC